MGICTDPSFWSTLDKANDYVCIYEYTNIARSTVPDSGDAYYWLIYAMTRLGMTEIARNELRAAKQVLMEDDYQDLIMRLNKDNLN